MPSRTEIAMARVRKFVAARAAFLTGWGIIMIAGVFCASAWLAGVKLATPVSAGVAASSASTDLRGPLIRSRQWLNSPPPEAGDFIGKTVLVNFWTYSCINSLRPLPYVRAWAKKYADRE